MTKYIFTSRHEAGIALGEKLRKEKYINPLVIGIPRGGLEVALEVSKILDAPLGSVSVKNEEEYDSDQVHDHFETLILVDDGLITGATARQAIKEVRENFHFDQLILAVPVCSYASYINMLGFVDDFICMLAPPECNTLEDWYKEFEHPEPERLRALVRKRAE